MENDSGFFDGLIPENLIEDLKDFYTKETGNEYDPEDLECIVNWMKVAIFDNMIVEMIFDFGGIIIDWDRDEDCPTLTASKCGEEFLQNNIELIDDEDIF